MTGLLDLSCRGRSGPAEIPGRSQIWRQPSRDPATTSWDRSIPHDRVPGRLTVAGFEQLLSLANQGVVAILDMEFITKDTDGKSRKVDIWEFAVPERVDLSA